MDLDVRDTWTCVSFRSGDKSDEMIVEIRKRFPWWSRKPDIVSKVAFVGHGFDWFRPPSFQTIQDMTIKYKLYDLWFASKRNFLTH